MPQDKNKYILKEARDYQILKKIYQLEKYKLSIVDVKTLKLIKTQLENNWRKPLIKYLDGLIRKYK